jgi:hypothetical protein
MALADVQVRVTYGTSGSETTETSDASDLNLLSSDLGSGETASDYPIRIPDAGTKYSYERWFRLYVSALNDSVKVKNIRVYSNDSSPITGSTLNYGQTASYATPVGGDTSSTIATSTIPTSEPSENLYIGGSSGGEITSGSSYSDYAVMQLEVPSTTTFEHGSATITVVWDEVA